MHAVMYLRMSSDKQERSIGDQRTECRKLAKERGFRIVSEYVDEAISGDATEKRVAFQRMIADAKDRAFDVIVAWDQDRIGRFDPIEAGFWLKPVRDAGVRIVTVAQGEIDLTDFAGRLLYTVQQEGKHQYLRDLARNSLRGRVARAKEGGWSGRPPFGYVIKDAALSLGDAEAIAAVRRVFELRSRGLGIRTIAKTMTEERRPSPTERGWHFQLVRAMLERRAYLGEVVYGKVPQGKYAQHTEGVIVVPDAHPAIISPELWAATRLETRKIKPSGRRGGRLSGLLYCGACGNTMYSTSNGTPPYKPFYACSTYHRSLGCAPHLVLQETVDTRVAAAIAKFAEEHLDELVQAIRKAQSRNRRDAERDAAEKRAVTLRKSIERGARRILSVPNSLVESVQRELVEMQRELQDIEAVLRVPVQQTDPDVLAASVRRLPDIIQTAKPSSVRAAARELLSKVTLRFEDRGETGRGRSRKFSDFTLEWTAEVIALMGRRSRFARLRFAA